MTDQNPSPVGEPVPPDRAIVTRRSGSLCTGILGLDRAVAQHFGAELAWYSEIEPAPCIVIEREHPAVPNLGRTVPPEAEG